MWIEDPFRSIIGGTIIIFVACAALMGGMSIIQAIV